MMPCRHSVLLLAMAITLWLSQAMAGEPQHGLALRTTVQYPPGFAHFRYADPRAMRGGVLTLASLGGCPRNTKVYTFGGIETPTRSPIVKPGAF